MITISLCMIVKDEQDVISRCLDSIKDIVDEIIIVDTGSTDNTKEIIKGYTDKVFDFEWVDDFSAARNYAFSKATKDFILWLDADDVILEEDREKFKELKQNLNNRIDAVMMKYNAGFDENGNVTLSYFRERLLNRRSNYQWMEPVHEYLKVSGKIINSDICITHKKEYESAKGRNLSIYQKAICQGVSLTPRALYYYARELYYNEEYYNAIRYFKRFLDTEEGWVEDNINACYILSICYNELNDKKNMLDVLLKSFKYDTPRAEICCQLGYYYFDNKDYERAIFWYKLALELEKPVDSWGFISHDHWDYIPCMQLCVCYDKLGNIEEAIKYNNKAEEYKPNDSAVAYNKEYFESINK
ncbi:glycosyltransferase [Clostridium sp. MSJ-11]|uniref:Glycosyltransferase n=1 Tax=Clostridium mobile TaxID=2841512 RepID=A0ABS6EL90_9CLOT|nr:glycosyltransferase [Clostridium mobile]MBU5485215.1 glycosyltransferase [Clostridium mobile]